VLTNSCKGIHADLILIQLRTETKYERASLEKFDGLAAVAPRAQTNLTVPVPTPNAGVSANQNDMGRARNTCTRVWIIVFNVDFSKLFNITETAHITKNIDVRAFVFGNSAV
jgi:hypothetical protein